MKISQLNCYYSETVLYVCIAFFI